MEIEPTLQSIAAALASYREEVVRYRTETTVAIDDVREAVQVLATHMAGEFGRVRAEMAGEFGRVRAEMATKDFVDRRVTDAETRLEGKIGTLVDVLEEKEVLSTHEARIVRVA